MPTEKKDTRTAAEILNDPIAPLEARITRAKNDLGRIQCEVDALMVDAIKPDSIAALETALTFATDKVHHDFNEGFITAKENRKRLRLIRTAQEHVSDFKADIRELQNTIENALADIV